jgi:hypothetical protein
MKKILSFLVLLAGITSLMSCGEKDATYDGIAPLTITKTDVLFSADGGEGSIAASTSAAVKATTDAKWITLSVNGSTVSVKAQPNVSLEARSAKIVLTADDGKTANVIATQHGLLLALNAKDAYIFDMSNSDPAIISDKSNIIFHQEISDDWIHIEKVSEGYSISVDPNESGNYRHGSIKLSFEAAQFTKTINIAQWGANLPFTSLTKAIYQDEAGNKYQKDITVVADTEKENTYLIKGLMSEGDLSMTYNASNKNMVEYYVSAGYSPGKLIDGETTYTLRCLMSAYNVNTGNRYYPTAVTTQAANAYRMAFEWQVDENAMPILNYVRNNTLSSTYTTDGIIVCKFSSATGAAAAARKGIAYEFLNLKFTY